MSFRAAMQEKKKKKNERKYKFTSRKLSMAGTGYSMMKRRKVYRHMQDSMNGPYEMKKTKTKLNRLNRLFQIVAE